MLLFLYMFKFYYYDLISNYITTDIFVYVISPSDIWEAKQAKLAERRRLKEESAKAEEATIAEAEGESPEGDTNAAAMEDR